MVRGKVDGKFSTLLSTFFINIYPHVCALFSEKQPFADALQNRCS